MVLQGSLKVFLQLASKLNMKHNHLHIVGKDGHLVFSVTDMESQIWYDMPYDGILEDFAVSVSLPPMIPLADDGFEDAVFNIGGNKLEIVKSRRVYTFDTLSLNVPDLMIHGETVVIPMDAISKLDVFSRLSETDDMKPQFDGVSMVCRDNVLTMKSSLSGYTLHEYSMAWDGDYEFIIPKRMMSLVRVLSKNFLINEHLPIEAGDRGYVVRVDGYVVSSRALGVKLPEFDIHAVKVPGVANVGTKDLLMAVNRCSESASRYSGTSVNLMLDFGKNQVTIREWPQIDQSNFRLTETLIGEVGDSEQVVVNPKLLKAILGTIHSQDVQIGYDDMRLIIQDGAMTHLLMGILK